MSRLDDLIDLIQTTNEVYFITAPGRVRTAYILVDDIVELALKTFLQEKALSQQDLFLQMLQQNGLFHDKRKERDAITNYFEEKIDFQELMQELKLDINQQTQFQGLISSLTPMNMLQHWSVNEPDDFKKYHEVIRDVKRFFSATSPAINMLDEVSLRHKERNSLYHDHKQSGLSINDDKCLRALCGMFNLLEQLYSDFIPKVQANNTVRCQIGVLRLKLAAHSGANEIVQPYIAALNQLKQGHQFDMNQLSVEHSLVHTVSYRFFNALREQFIASIGQLQLRVDEIGRMKRPQPKHQSEMTDKQQLIQILQNQLNDINTLI